MSRYKKIIVCLGILGFFLATSGGRAAEWKPKEKFMKIGTASPTGLWYLTGARLAAEIERTVPGIKVSSTTGSAIQNPMKVNSGEIQIGLTYTPQTVSAYYGIDPYFKGKPHKNLRVMTVNNLCGYTFVVSKKSKIYRFGDLYNARISPAPKTYSAHIVTKWLLELYGITFDSIEKAGGKVAGLGYSDATASIQDGLLDGFVNIPAGPMAHIINLAHNPGIRILPMEEKMRDKILADPRFKGWVKMTIPAGAYQGIEKPVPTIGTVEVFLVNKNVSDELVYRATKLVYESEGIRDIYKAAREKGFPKGFDVSIAKNGMVIPIHPGAERYFKEKGVSIPPIKK